ncbi:response regulator [Streptomyces sp. McG3]|nr:response regulator [Streptomyces sp. McG3]
MAPGDGASAHHARTAPEAGHTPPQAHPVAPAHPGPQTDGTSGQGFPATPGAPHLPGAAPHAPGPHDGGVPEAPNPAPDLAPWGDTGQNADTGQNVPSGTGQTGAGRTTHTTGDAAVADPVAHPADGDAGVPAPDARRQPLPAEEPMPDGSNPDSTQGRAFSVRTLGQGVPFAQHLAHQQNQPHQSLGGAGRRRKLAAPPEGDRSPARTAADRPGPAQPTGPAQAPGPQQHQPRTHPQDQGQDQGPDQAQEPGRPGQPAQGGPGAAYGEGQLLAQPVAEGRAYAIGAPDEGAEGPEPLDGPGGAVEVANRPHPHPVDDELPPEPLDNPRRLLVWPAPDVPTQQALSDRGYRPVIVNSREEVDAQIAAFPAALFVDPLTGPITRTALQSLRQAAVAAEVPVLVTAGLGQATREAAYGADPAVLLKALAPRDSEQHPSRVLLIEEHEEIAVALTQTLERRGMQVARAATDSEAVDLAGRMRPNLVVMDLMQVRRRRAGIIDWLRANGQLNRTPLVVYTSAGMDRAELPRLASGETVLFLAERSTSDEVQSRIVDLLAKIGTN